MSGAEGIGPLIGRDAYRYLAVFWGVSTVFGGTYGLAQGGRIEDCLSLLWILFLIAGLPSLALVVIARLLTWKRGLGTFPAACATLLLLPALFPLMVGAWSVSLVQLIILIGFLVWNAGRRPRSS
ncbi:hypothetical protein [Streptomyces hydrogenans]|uniref:hypothetical protein n=1 Tax=Streptomyces hydrogenans TaxID=1873719 RepID=UPI0036EB1BD3